MAILLPDPIRIGEVRSAHGVKGEIVVKHFLAKPKDIEKWNVIMLELNPQSYIPFFIESVRSVNEEDFIVKLQEIDSPEQAKELRHLRVYANPLLKKVDLAHHDYEGIIGFTLVSKNDNFTATLLSLETISGQQFFNAENNGKSLLIPLQEEFIDNIDALKKTVFLNLPDGYIEAFLD
jgi:16S rRNA processing protein RimM